MQETEQGMKVGMIGSAASVNARPTAGQDAKSVQIGDAEDVARR